MKKIPTIFERDPHDLSRVHDVINPWCQWVFDGEGVSTRKWDGTCCLIREGSLYKRREVKKGKPTPEGFELLEEDKLSGEKVGWVLLDFEDNENRWHKEAWDVQGALVSDGTYELCGPKVNGNPEGFTAHRFIRHGEFELGVPRNYWGLKADLTRFDMEGIVFYHPDGRRGKIKKKDFGLRRKNES